MNMELVLLTELLEALTHFLDEEEKLGFLHQDVVDRLIFIENMINEVIFGMTRKKDTSLEISQQQELMYVPAIDESADDEFTYKNHHQNEF